MGLHCLPDRSTVFGKKLTSLLKPSYAWILSNMLKYFLNLWSFQTLFTFGIGPDILINVLEGCIVFLIWSAWALPNFHLKQKQEFSVWNFTENASFISFHGGILSRYSEINKFKTSIFKTSIFIFLEVTKTHHKMQVSKSTSCIMRLAITNMILKFKPMIKKTIMKNYTFFAVFTFSKINSFAYINSIIMQDL